MAIQIKPAEIIETSVFTRRVIKLLSDDEYRKLQSVLVNRPDMGAIIPASGGLRKLRWTLTGRGKRGGLRLIYFWAVKQKQLLMLFLFAKNELDDITPEQCRILRKIVEEEYP